MQWSTGSAVSGLIFGSALTLSGVASPQVIRDQFKMADFHMLITFLTASASSAAVIAAYNSRSGARPLPTKPDSSLGWIGKYDGNVIGGAMIGLGMSLTGACPGTVLVQATAGIGKSRLLVGVSVLAGTAFAKWKQHGPVHVAPSNGANGTIMAVSGWSRATTLVIYQAVMITAIATALAFASRGDALIHPVLGGLLIGAGQLSSVLLVNKTVGVSGAYEEIGKLAGNIARGKGIHNLSDSLVFAVGLIAGAGVTMLSVPATLDVLVGSEAPSLISTLIGGFVLIFGARIAGGCTSGHGISGMAGMWLSSFITVASMFGMGILASFLIR